MKKTIFLFLFLGAACCILAGRLCAQSAPDCCTGLPITFPGLNSPGQIALDPVNGELFVPNSSDRTLRVFNSATGAPVTVFSTWSGGATFTNPTSVSCDTTGNFYVSDYTIGVEEFSPAFAFLGLIGPINCTGIYVDSGGTTTSLYVCSQDNHVYRYDSISGGTYAAAATIGAGALSQPDAVVRVGNTVYVTDEAGLVIGFTVPGYAPTTLYSNSTSPMRGICAGSNGLIYATEWNNAALDIFSPGYWTNPPTCNLPSAFGVAVNSVGNLYVSEINGTVTVVQGCGAQATPPIPNCCQAGWTITSGTLPDVQGLAYDSSGPGTLYAGGQSMILGLDPLTGGVLNNSMPASFDSITDLALGGDGYLYAADYNSKLFQVQLPSGAIVATFNLTGEIVRSLCVAPGATEPDLYAGCDSGNVYRITRSGASYTPALITFSSDATPTHQGGAGVLFQPGAAGAPATLYLSDSRINQRLLQYVQTSGNDYAYNNYWQTSNGNIFLGRITQDASGNIYVGGMQEYFTFDPAFNLRWACNIGPVYGQSIAVDPSGNVYTGHQSQETIVQLHCSPPLPTATSTSSYPGSNPPAPGQCYVFPSPVKGDQASVAYDMAGPGIMTLKIFNRIGELAAQVAERRPAGVQASSFSVSGFAPGIYFFTVTLNYDSGRTEKPKAGKFAVIR